MRVREMLVTVVYYVVVWGVAALLVVAGWWARGYVEAHRQWATTVPIVVGRPQPPLSVDVRPGDTLWGIAREFYPDHHTGRVVHAIRELNPHLDPGRLQVGDMVRLPRLEDL